MKSKTALLAVIVLETICYQSLLAKTERSEKGNPTTSNYYGVRKKNPNKPQAFTSKAKEAIDNLHIKIENDTVYLWSANLEAVQRFFSGARDGVYIDVVFRDKFSCEKQSDYDINNISNGIMLKPVYFPEIYAHNRVKLNNNLHYPIAYLPPSLKYKQFTTNIGYIYGGTAFYYREVKEIFAKNMPTLYLFPKYITNADKHIIPDSFSTTLKFEFGFERDETKLSKESKADFLKKMKIYAPYLSKVRISTHSSVEGSLEKNIALQKARAEELVRLVKMTTDKDVKYNTEMSENWDMFNALIKNTPFAHLMGYSKEEVKKRLDNKFIRKFLEYELYRSRMATLEVTFTAAVNDNSPPELILGSYKNAIDNDDTLKAFKAQNRLMDEVFKRNFSRVDLLSVYVPRKKIFTQLWTNYLALACTNSEDSYSYHVKDTALKAIKIDSTDKYLQFNFCILALRYFEQYHEKIIPTKYLEQKMNYCYKNISTPEDTMLVNNMFLNYSLIGLYEANDYHLYNDIPIWLHNVSMYYKPAKLSAEEAVKLALIYNYYGRAFDACTILLPYIKQETNNMDVIKVFATTYVPSFEMIPEYKHMDYLKQFKTARPAEFHDWIDKHSFLYLQNLEIKNMFCQL